jgi:hypothetical protein
VNTNSLAKQYDKLSPWERLPMIMAASARSDEAERSRLAHSAPKIDMRTTDYFGLAMAFRKVSDLHFMELLNLAALYFQSMGLAGVRTTDEEESARILEAGLLFGYLFKLQLAGWRQFCAEFHFAPDLCWSCLPGNDMIKRAEKLADRAAFMEEGALAYLRRGDEENSNVLTADNVAAGLRECLIARAKRWR